MHGIIHIGIADQRRTRFVPSHVPRRKKSETLLSHQKPAIGMRIAKRGESVAFALRGSSLDEKEFTLRKNCLILDFTEFFRDKARIVIAADEYGNART